MVRFTNIIRVTAFILLSAFTQAGNAQTTLEGVWILDSIELFKYSGNDSIKASNDLLPESLVISGAFEAITFTKDNSSVTIDGQSFESPYRKTDNILELMPLPIPHEYIIISEDNNHLLLYRKYTLPSDDPMIQLYYGIKLNYVKQ
jgi:hypothetical protein